VLLLLPQMSIWEPLVLLLLPLRPEASAAACTSDCQRLATLAASTAAQPACARIKGSATFENSGQVT
jgi:hypothetical protein